MSAADDLVIEAAIRGHQTLYETLEFARRSICCYTRDPCDCKYGRTAYTRPGSEATGCPELRDLIYQLTGFSPFNRGQTIEQDVQSIGARIRDAVVAV